MYTLFELFNKIEQIVMNFRFLKHWRAQFLQLYAAP